MEARVLLIESMIADNKAATEVAMKEIFGKVTTCQEATAKIGDGLQQVTVEMQTYSRDLSAQKSELMRDLDAEFDSHKLALANVVNAAREEFGKLQSHITGLHAQTAQTFAEVREKVEAMEKDFRQGGRDKGPDKSSGFLPIKSMVPPVFGNNEDKWRSWQEDVADYIDSQQNGLKEVLKGAERQTDPIGDSWMQAQTEMHAIVVERHKANVYRALKALTTGEARTVVAGIRAENGYEAWRALHQRFGPSVAARQGRVMHELSQMVSKPAKTSAETRSLVTELERRIRVAEEITGDQLGDAHVKSILAAILDPVTRAHTSAYQGAATKYHDLKRVVLEFANNTAVVSSSGGKSDTGPEPMQLGQCGEHSHIWDVAAAAADESMADDEEMWEKVGDLAVVKATTQCYNCGGLGHLAQQCPSSPTKGAGKSGKGGKKGGGKGDLPKGGPKGGQPGKGGGRKGPPGGCWNCAGPHYASECPMPAAPAAWTTKGGGKGGKGAKGGFNAMEHWWPEPSVRSLCSLRVSETHVANRFAALVEEDVEYPALTKTTLADYMPDPAVKRNPAPKVKKLGGMLSPLVTVEPAGLNPVAAAPEWEAIELAVDSGASETVIPEDIVRSVAVAPSEASKRGVEYEVANGHRIPNLGQKTFQAVTPEGVHRGITAQVCEVNKPLMSVSKLVRSGNTVVFAPDGAYVQDNHTAERIYLHESGGMYMMRMWVPAQGF